MASCRIYRDDASSHERRNPAASEAPPTEESRTAVDRQAPSAPASDALNLWVLNRPKGELSPLTTDRPERAPVEKVDERPKPAVLVVLGVGQGEPCALQFARRGVARLMRGENPVETVVDLIEGARRWRWPVPSSTWSALLRSSAGHLGGVQSAPAWALSPALLRAVERHAFLGGSLPRWPAEPAARGELGSCDSAPDPALDGTIGVLVRTGNDDFYGGVASLDPVADAGSVSVWAQYGVSLAVGRRGGVLLVGACPVPRPEVMAERVYASDNWALASAELATPDDCRTGHALLTEERAWVIEGPLAWALAEAELSAPPAALLPTGSQPPGDAGNGPSDAAVAP